MGNEEEQRGLSAAEQRRLTAFEALAENLRAQGYSQTELTSSIVRANVFAIASGIPFCIVFLLAFNLLHTLDLSAITSLGIFAFILVMIVLIVVHEAIHGITWALFAKNGFADIEFGFIKEALTPYCTCKTPLSKRAYIIGAAMPCIVLGFIPSIIGIATGSLAWLLTGLVMTMSAGGDAMIVWNILSYRSTAQEVLYIDHPMDIGGVIFER